MVLADLAPVRSADVHLLVLVGVVPEEGRCVGTGALADHLDPGARRRRVDGEAAVVV